jgi:D-3-phosphoglycerate dehydrogenase
MVFIRNLDKPGLIGNLGTLMGKGGINIAAMALGRNKPGDKAISVWSVDNQVSAEIQDKIKKIENILTVKVIKI